MICVECLRSFLFLVGTDGMPENIFFVNQRPLNTTIELYCKKHVIKFVSKYRNYLTVVDFW